MKAVLTLVAAAALLSACGEKKAAEAPSAAAPAARDDGAPRPIAEILGRTLATFDAFDADKDGKVTPAERQAAVERREARTGVGGRAGMEPEDMGAADADKDGAVTRAEVEALVRTRLDPDGDGMVTSDDLWEGFRTRRSATP